MGQFSFIPFIRSQLTKLPSLQPTDLSERTVMIVGANVGLGLEAIRHLAGMPQPPKHLVIACRSKSKGEAAIADVKRTTGYSVELLIVDMASFTSVSAFATTFKEKYDRLDVLILNAGVVQPTYEATVDGLDINTQVNHLSTMMIALLLLPIMQHTARTHNTFPHLSITSSDMHFMADMTPELVNSPDPIARLSSKEHCTKKDLAKRYELTKMLNMIFVRSLNSHLSSSSKIVVCGINPGFCHSSIRRNIKFPMTILIKLMEATIARETAEGAKTLVHAGTNGLPESKRSEREAMRGAYMSDCRPEEPSDFLLSETGQTFEAKVWAESIEILAKKDPRVQEVVSQYLNHAAHEQGRVTWT